MPDSNLSLSAEEREFLLGLLERVLKETRLEEHRTETPSYRAHVIHNEDLLRAILEKLGKAAK